MRDEGVVVQVIADLSFRNGLPLVHAHSLPERLDSRIQALYERLGIAARE
jgi:hypothetical protein